MDRLMTRVRHILPFRRTALAVVCTPLAFALLGCPADTSTTATVGSVPAYKTAPTTPTALQQQQQAQAAQTIADNEHAQKVQAIIAHAEASYASGVQNYNNDRLDAARQDFDYAVDTMLGSGMDLKTDPALADEFDRLISAINSLEMVALKQGNGFSQRVEPAPLDEAMSQVTFPPDPALVGKVQGELKTTQSDLPLVVNDYVAGFINYFTNNSGGHAHLLRSLERAGKYKEMISKILRDNGVPQDLIYQAVAESGFQPQAMNAKSGAGGMWQFMPFASSYGLVRNGYFDERFDPEKSTVAYAHYMKSLYNQFGDWYLAMAAYDWGPGNVQRVVSRTGYADFWELYRHNALPTETKNYVPGILAAIIMAKNPSQYGLTDLVPDAAVLSDTVTTSYAVDLRLVADLTGSTVPAIVALNPALLRLATPTDIPYDLHVPPGTRDIYLDRIKDIPEDKRASWRFHIVKDGESIDQIADALHARATEIATFNEITPSHPMEVGDELIVPVATVIGASAGQQRYKVGRSDTLVSIADRFGITVDQLKSWNHLYSSHPKAGTSLYVAEPVRLAPGFSRSSHRSHTTHSTSHSTSHTSSHSSHTSSHTSSSHASGSHTSSHSTSSTTSHASASTSHTHASTSSSKKKKTTTTH
jgi:membrane-bound lytic murein transglycosylase D